MTGSADVSARLPDFLVIGAQKCGTTTLYEDLRSHPCIRIADKESSVLIDGERPRAELSAERLRRGYAAALPHRVPGGLLGEVATTYAMLPQYPAVVPNALRVLPHLKIIYIVREPVSRVISHHHHDFALGLTGPDINRAVHDHPVLLANTRYATQIKPWLEAYGPQAVLVLRFEDYVADRQTGMSNVLEFLGTSPFRLPDANTVHNAADAKRIRSGVLGRVALSKVYRSRFRSLIPEEIRRVVSQNMLPKAPPRPDPPRPETIEFIVEQLWPEVQQLARLQSTGPWWDRRDMLRSSEDHRREHQERGAV